VTCGDCGTPLRSSWSKDRDKSYACYLCQTKKCASYGKSISRDMLEGEIGDIVPLRANKSETIDMLKFTLEGAGERSDGNARTPARRLDLLAWS